MIGSLLEWMGSTSWSVALRESRYVWPLLESTHVLTLCLFVGTAFVTDLRLLGWTMKMLPEAPTAASEASSGVDTTEISRPPAFRS